MKIIFHRLLLSAVLGLPIVMLSAHDSPAQAEDLTVMTWNLEWFYDENQGDNYSKLAKEQSAPSRKDWEWKRDQVAKSLADAKPSVVGLQEVESRRILWYLTRSLDRNFSLEYRELGIQSRDHFTEQDVGFLVRPPVDVVSIFQGVFSRQIPNRDQFNDVTKHLMVTLDVPVGNSFERVHVMNLHLRARAEVEPIRMKQARLVHRWIEKLIQAGENVIVLGDFNTEERGNTTRPNSDVGIIAGLETATTNDDLVDLNLRLPRGDRQTHLLDGRQFDRILCSRSLLTDDPDRVDLVFKKIEVRRDLCVRGKPDTADEHWDSYWKMSEQERDLSDHYPLIATFEPR